MELRLDIFVANAKAVVAHNEAYQNGWTLYAQTIMNSPFSDLTHEEFTATHLMESQNAGRYVACCLLCRVSKRGCGKV